MSRKHGIFSQNDLQCLLKDQNSCVKLKKSTILLQLHPYFLNNIKDGIWNALKEILTHYDARLGGILLGYMNVKVDQNSVVFGRGNTGAVQYTVHCDCFIFQPVMRCVLEGVVCKISPDHIGCLVHDYFNATISRPESDDSEVWANRQINFGEKLIFRVKDLDFTGIIPYIEGELFDPTKETEEDENEWRKNSDFEVLPQIPSEDMKVISPLHETLLSPIPVEKHPISSDQVKKEKSLSSSESENPNETLFAPIVNSTYVDQIDEMALPKKKMKEHSKRKEKVYDDPPLAHGSEILDRDEMYLKKKKTKKDKHSKSKEKGYDDSPLDHGSENLDKYEMYLKEKKKDKHSKSIEKGYEDPPLDHDSEILDEGEMYLKKKKTKKDKHSKSKEKGYDDPPLDHGSENLDKCEMYLKEKQKKKDKHSKSKEKGYDDPPLDHDSEILDKDETYLKKKDKQFKSKEKGYDDPPLDHGSEILDKHEMYLKKKKKNKHSKSKEKGYDEPPLDNVSEISDKDEMSLKKKKKKDKHSKSKEKCDDDPPLDHGSENLDKDEMYLKKKKKGKHSKSKEKGYDVPPLAHDSEILDEGEIYLKKKKKDKDSKSKEKGYDDPPLDHVSEISDKDEMSLKKKKKVKRSLSPSTSVKDLKSRLSNEGEMCTSKSINTDKRASKNYLSSNAIDEESTVIKAASVNLNFPTSEEKHHRVMPGQSTSKVKKRKSSYNLRGRLPVEIQTSVSCNTGKPASKSGHFGNEIYEAKQFKENYSSVDPTIQAASINLNFPTSEEKHHRVMPGQSTSKVKKRKSSYNLRGRLPVEIQTSGSGNTGKPASKSGHFGNENYEAKQFKEKYSSVNPEIQTILVNINSPSTEEKHHRVMPGQSTGKVKKSESSYYLMGRLPVAIQTSGSGNTDKPASKSGQFGNEICEAKQFKENYSSVDPTIQAVSENRNFPNTEEKHHKIIPGQSMCKLEINERWNNLMGGLPVETQTSESGNTGKPASKSGHFGNEIYEANQFKENNSSVDATIKAGSINLNSPSKHAREEHHKIIPNEPTSNVKNSINAIIDSAATGALLDKKIAPLDVNVPSKKTVTSATNYKQSSLMDYGLSVRSELVQSINHQKNISNRGERESPTKRSSKKKSARSYVENPHHFNQVTSSDVKCDENNSKLLEKGNLYRTPLKAEIKKKTEVPEIDKFFRKKLLLEKIIEIGSDDLLESAIGINDASEGSSVFKTPSKNMKTLKNNLKRSLAISDDTELSSVKKKKKTTDQSSKSIEKTRKASISREISEPLVSSTLPQKEQLSVSKGSEEMKKLNYHLKKLQKALAGAGMDKDPEVLQKMLVGIKGVR